MHDVLCRKKVAPIILQFCIRKARNSFHCSELENQIRNYMCLKSMVILTCNAIWIFINIVLSWRRWMNEKSFEMSKSNKQNVKCNTSIFNILKSLIGIQILYEDILLFHLNVTRAMYNLAHCVYVYNKTIWNSAPKRHIVCGQNGLYLHLNLCLEFTKVTILHWSFIVSD